jgi:hypothetical protein
MYTCIWMIECLSALCYLNSTDAMDAGPYEVVSICSRPPLTFPREVVSICPRSVLRNSWSASPLHHQQLGLDIEPTVVFFELF